MTRTDELVTCAICDPFLTKEEEEKKLVSAVQKNWMLAPQYVLAGP